MPLSKKSLGTLITCCNIRKMQEDFAGAVIMAEEAYNLVAIAVRTGCLV
jgi:hypothetical protein